MLAQGGHGGHTVDSFRPPVKTVGIIGVDNNQIGKIGSQRLSGRVKCLTIDVRQPAAPFLGTFDLIVSNPPYVTTAEMETLDPSVRDYEPHLALWGGDDGLDFYRAIVRNFTPALNPSGWLCFEFGMGQDAAVCDLLRRAGYEIAELKKDTADITRAVLARKREEG
jgi:release factor glutamine methyltransferase